MSDDLAVRLLGAIDEREAVAREAAKYSAEEWTTASSAVLDLGLPDLDGLIPLPASPIGHHMEANDPRAVLRLCQAHRDIVAMFPASAPHLDTEGSFYGFQSRDCGEHRTAGSHRAWCFDCSEWCYPKDPCRRCHGVSDVLRALARGYGLEGQ